MDLLRSTSSNQLFSVAIEAGYYDTAHLSKEIKSLIRQYTRFLFILTGYGRNHINISETIKSRFFFYNEAILAFLTFVPYQKLKRNNGIT